MGKFKKSMASVFVVLVPLIVLGSCFAAGLNIWLDLFVGLAMMWILVLGFFNLCPKLVHRLVHKKPKLLSFAKMMRSALTRSYNDFMSPIERFFLHSTLSVFITVGVLHFIMQDAWEERVYLWLMVISFVGGLCIWSITKLVRRIRLKILDEDTAFYGVLSIFMFGVTICTISCAITFVFNVYGGLDISAIILGVTVGLSVIFGMLVFPIWMIVSYLCGK